jgi:3-phosphoshikimate 1-carboxyvinyltransferase
VDMRVQEVHRLSGEIRVPGDKSISHRAVMLGSLAEGTTRVTGFLPGADCQSTVACFRQMGVEISQPTSDRVVIQGRGLYSLEEPNNILDAGNSGTTMRLILGILAGQEFFSVVTGDASLRTRPLGRVIKPLRLMGADIRGRRENTLAPVSIMGRKKLTAIEFAGPVSSAQVKSAILLAGLYARGRTTISQPMPSRDHTERMLRLFGAQIETREKGTIVSITGQPVLKGQELLIPGDISSAAFFLVAGSLIPGSEVMIENVGINPTRSGILQVMQTMGADINLLRERRQCGEPVADILVRHAPLKGVEIGGTMIPSLIDEIPVLAVAATQAAGTTTFRDASELRFKETDRIKTVASELSRMGAKIIEQPDGLVIEGPTPLRGCRCHSHGDHRIAMALAVAGLTAKGETVIQESESVDISFPGFFETIKALLG